MEYKNVRALCRKDMAILPGIISTNVYNKKNQSDVEFFEKKYNDKESIVIIPAEFSLEHYMEKDVKVASYAYYASVKVFDCPQDASKKNIEVGYGSKERCLIKNIEIKGGDIFVDVETLPRQEFREEHAQIRKEIFERFKEFLKFGDVSIAGVEAVKNANDIDKLITEISLSCGFEIDAKRKILEELNDTKRLELVLSEIETRIYETRSEKGKNIFSYYKKKVNSLNLKAEVKRNIFSELTRLKTVKETQSEYGNIVDWLDRVLALPWNIIKEENTDVQLAKKRLDETHYGMDKLKQRILDYIVLKVVSGKNPSQIMCLYGPPGVGKSTIAKSIANALNKDFYNISLGGIGNPEEIGGMKRFFIGAKPGRIMEGVSNAGSKNCIILLDEIDKMGRDGFRGDPYGVLLDILDKNQNAEFKDRYFDIPFDLSNVMFIATANSLKTIPEPVLNRLEIVTLEGYSLNEKVHIAQNYVIPKTLKEIGVGGDLITIEDETLQKIIEDYTFESGVRQLERMIMEICKKYIVGETLADRPLDKKTISLVEARKYLGDFREERYNTAFEGEIGVVNELSVSGPYGAVNRLEISLVKGKGEQILSDNLVGTAKWTFKTVFGLLKSKAEKWGIDLKVFDENNFYIHSPHHSIYYDGPSGGVADVMCLVSAIKEIPVNHKVAFTGEISLKGKVLAIGGIREKLLAAQQNKMETVVVPLDNKKDIEKLSNEIVGNIRIKYVDNIDEAYKFIFEENCKIK